PPTLSWASLAFVRTAGPQTQARVVSGITCHLLFCIGSDQFCRPTCAPGHVVRQRYVRVHALAAKVTADGHEVDPNTVGGHADHAGGVVAHLEGRFVRSPDVDASRPLDLDDARVGFAI